MPRSELTDPEVAVVLDSLAAERDRLRKRVVDTQTPNIDSALEKIGGLVSPATSGLTISTEDTDAKAALAVLVTVLVAYMEEDQLVAAIQDLANRPLASTTVGSDLINALSEEVKS